MPSGHTPVRVREWIVTAEPITVDRAVGPVPFFGPLSTGVDTRPRTPHTVSWDVYALHADGTRVPPGINRKVDVDVDAEIVRLVRMLGE